MASSTAVKSSSSKRTGAKSTKSAAAKRTKSTKNTGRKSAAKSAAPVAPVRPSSAPVLTGKSATAFVTPESRLAAAKPGQLLVRRFDEHRELAQLATKRFQTTASRPGADPTKQSGVTTANIADCAAALKSRKTTAEKLLNVPVADVVKYAETGILTKRAESAELTKTLRDFSIAVFGSGTRNKLRGKRIAAALSVLMDGGTKQTKQPTKSAAKSASTKSATKRASAAKSTKGGRK